VLICVRFSWIQRRSCCKSTASVPGTWSTAGSVSHWTIPTDSTLPTKPCYCTVPSTFISSTTVSLPLSCTVSDWLPPPMLLVLVLWHCWSGDRKGIRPCEKLGVGLLVMMMWLELCVFYSSSCHHHFHYPLLQFTPANPGSPGIMDVKTERERERERTENGCRVDAYHAVYMIIDKMISK